MYLNLNLNLKLNRNLKMNTPSHTYTLVDQIRLGHTDDWFCNLAKNFALAAMLGTSHPHHPSADIGSHIYIPIYIYKSVVPVFRRPRPATLLPKRAPRGTVREQPKSGHYVSFAKRSDPKAQLVSPAWNRKCVALETFEAPQFFPTPPTPPPGQVNTGRPFCLPN